MASTAMRLVGVHFFISSFHSSFTWKLLISTAKKPRISRGQWIHVCSPAMKLFQTHGSSMIRCKILESPQEPTKTRQKTMGVSVWFVVEKAMVFGFAPRLVRCSRRHQRRIVSSPSRDSRKGLPHPARLAAFRHGWWCQQRCQAEGTQGESTRGQSGHVFSS